MKMPKLTLVWLLPEEVGHSWPLSDLITANEHIPSNAHLHTSMQWYCEYCNQLYTMWLIGQSGGLTSLPKCFLEVVVSAYPAINGDDTLVVVDIVSYLLGDTVLVQWRGVVTSNNRKYGDTVAVVFEALEHFQNYYFSHSKQFQQVT